MLYDLINICGTLLENSLFLWLFAGLFSKKFSGNMVYLILAAIQTILIVVIKQMLALTVQNVISIICITVYLIVGALFFKGKFLMKMVASIGYYIVLVLIDYVVITMFSLAFSDRADMMIQQIQFYVWLVFVSKSGLVLAIWLLMRIFKNKLNFYHVSMVHWMTVLGVQSTLFFLVVFVLWSKIVTRKAVWLQMFILLIVFGVFILGIYMLKIIREGQINQIRSEFLQKEVELRSEYIHLAQREAQNTKQLYHDINKHLSYLAALLSLQEYEAAENYLQKTTNSLGTLPGSIETGHETVNIILAYQLKRMEEEHIKPQLEISGLNNVKIDDLDLVILLGNVLDNAIKAAIEVNHPVIKIKMIYENNKLLISIVNPCAKPVKIKNQMVKTPSKSGHGLGLYNIKEVVEKYHGEYMLEYQDGNFYFICEI
ncbi:MAG: GHKL domain-containing protein [Massiliimalia sp.]|jgi:two-component system sensor histidine kinase AgrC